MSLLVEAQPRAGDRCSRRGGAACATPRSSRRRHDRAGSHRRARNAFEWIADADPRLGPDAGSDGRRQILLGAVHPPAHARYRAAGRSARPGLDAGAFRLDQRRRSLGFIPTRYPGSRGRGRSRAGAGAAAPNGGNAADWFLRPGPAHAGDGCRGNRADGHAPASNSPLPTTARPEPWRSSRSRERLQPSLLDRLTDDAPEQKREIARPADAEHAAASPGGAARSRLAAQHHQPGRRPTISPKPPLAATSTMNFGIPGFAGLIGRRRDGSARWKAASPTAIRAFEPRIRPEIAARARPRAARGRMPAPALVFEIEGELWAQPVPQQLVPGDLDRARNAAGRGHRYQGARLMDPRLLRLYESELAFVRDMGGEFAARIPEDRRPAGSRQHRGRRSVCRTAAGGVRLPDRPHPAEDGGGIPDLHAVAAADGLSALPRARRRRWRWCSSRPDQAAIRGMPQGVDAAGRHGAAQPARHRGPDQLRIPHRACRAAAADRNRRRRIHRLRRRRRGAGPARAARREGGHPAAAEGTPAMCRSTSWRWTR